MTADPHVLESLYRTLERRRGDDPTRSYTAKLLAGGKERVAKKLGEEAVEAVIAGIGSERSELVKESADLLYHLLVLWLAAGVSPDEVWAELRRREGVSGIAEKAARPTRQSGAN